MNVSSFTCPCGCALKLSASDVGQLEWLRELGGERTGYEMPVSMSAATSSSGRRLFDSEPMATLVCGHCGGDVEVAVYIADFLKRWGMGKPDCANCHRIRRGES